ncbi:MAG TPA: NAD(P)H-hydrate epimerase, partial [Polyangiaceae bacterium]|nr:NAD(P)H-hydrate epimerase [Polyangiaceae bacterium]
MTPVLSRAQMRDFDAYAVEKCRVPSLLLMENAGSGATDVLVREMLGGKARGRRAVVVCGSGNNGGDGLVIARHLAVRDARPVV